VFAIAARLFGLILGTLTQAGQQMWPALGDALTRGDTEWVRRRFRLSMLATGGIASAGSLFLVAFGQPIARIWVGEHYVPPLGLLVAFAVWTVYMTVITQYGYLLMSIGRVWALAGLSLLIAAVNLAASIVLTTWLGLEGPILGNLVGAAVVQLVPTIVLTRRLVRRLGLHGDPVPEMTPAAPEV
jgi:O-antigen/teichoic acid export membrane protein